MERVVLTIGGSTLAPAELDPAYLRTVADTIRALAADRRLLVVIGGGNPARRYIQAARKLAVGEEDLDRIGVAATRLNAQLLASILHEWGLDVEQDVPLTVAASVAASDAGRRVVVSGGTTPGHSTDYVGAELAEAAEASRLVIVTNVAGVYTKDPNRHPDATHKPELSFEELLQIIEEKEWTTAGAPGVIDGPATVLIATKGIPTAVVAGDDLANVAAAVRGEPFHGTRVSGTPVELA